MGPSGSDSTFDRPPFRLDRSGGILRLRARVPSSREAINGCVRRVMRFATRCGCAGDREGLEIALREALANAVIHGNADTPGKRVFVRCYGENGVGMVVAIRDEGGGFDHENVPDPREGERRFLHHGRGLFLMRELMDRVEYRKGGREVVLYKACSDPD